MEAGRIIGFDEKLIGGLVIQEINTIFLIAMYIVVIIVGILLIRLIWLGIKALEIYIRKNSYSEKKL